MRIPIYLFNIYSRVGSGRIGSRTIQCLEALCGPSGLDVFLLVAGDFNTTFAPLAGLSSSITEEEDTQWLIPALQLPVVKRLSPAALQLLSFTLNMGLRACNGRSPSDREGNHTYKRVNCNSRIDYFLLDTVGPF